MPRPYLGVKQYKVRIHPTEIARIKEVHRIRKKKNPKCTEGQAARDAFHEGLKRLEIIL